MPWTDTEDRKLLLAVIAVAAPGTPDWEAVSKLMTDKTKEAVRSRSPSQLLVRKILTNTSQRYQKLKRKTTDTAKAGDASPEEVAPAKTGRKRAAKVKNEDDADGDNDEALPTAPITKKRATKATKKKAAVAAEDEADAEADGGAEYVQSLSCMNLVSTTSTDWLQRHGLSRASSTQAQAHFRQSERVRTHGDDGWE